MNRHTATYAAKAANNIGTLVEQSRELVGTVRNKAIGVALGIGAILGFLLANRGSGKSAKNE